MIDWGNGPNGIQSPAGHRDNIMDSDWQEVGISIGFSTPPTNDDVGPEIITQDFGRRGNFGDAMITGVAFTDGRQVGATLDRNGLRPARFCVTDDGYVIMASESGVLPVKEDNIVRKWRLQPGKMLLIDMEQGRIIEDEEIKTDLAKAEPYAKWLESTQYNLKDLDLDDLDDIELPADNAINRTVVALDINPVNVNTRAFSQIEHDVDHTLFFIAAGQRADVGKREPVLTGAERDVVNDVLNH